MLRRDGRVPQPRRILTVDDPFDLRAVDSDVLQRAIVELMQLAYRRPAFAPERVGAPPFTRRRDDRSANSAGEAGSAPRSGTQPLQDGGEKVAQRLGARGFRTGDDLLPLVGGQAVEIKGSF